MSDEKPKRKKKYSDSKCPTCGVFMIEEYEGERLVVYTCPNLTCALATHRTN